MSFGHLLLVAARRSVFDPLKDRCGLSVEHCEFCLGCTSFLQASETSTMYVRYVSDTFGRTKRMCLAIPPRIGLGCTLPHSCRRPLRHISHASPALPPAVPPNPAAAGTLATTAFSQAARFHSLYRLTGLFSVIALCDVVVVQLPISILVSVIVTLA